MIRQLQFILFLICFILFSASFAQNERTKTSKAELKTNLQIATPVKITPVNVYEQKESSESKPETQTNSVMQLKSGDSLLVNKREPSLKNDNTFSNTQKVFLSDNVTYVKEDLPVTEKTFPSEKKLVKVLPSENYTPRVIKEDIRPTVDYIKVEISSGKRIFLQQEADDLQQEINQNYNDSNFDLAKKQKQLEDLKKMLQK